MKDSIIAEIRSASLRTEPAQLVYLHNGMVIAISRRALACFKNDTYLNDPLGNGLLSFCEIPEAQSIGFDGDTCVTTFKSGYVGLHDGKALVIAPNSVRLYPNNHDGLRGTNCIADISLSEIDML